MNQKNILNIAFYRFQNVENLAEQRKYFLEICQKYQLKGSVLLSPEGINGFLAGDVSQVQSFQQALEQNVEWAGLSYKESYSSHVPFQKLFIKLKKEIIPLGDPKIQPAKFTAPRITPKELKAWLDEGREIELLDTRNAYELEHGTFRGAVRLELNHFRDFPEKINSLPQEKKERTTVMFCTGGIRCEKAGAVALEQGFREVFQLDGGILKYFEECGGSHYVGNCFVFDERVAVDPNLEPVASPVS